MSSGWVYGKTSLRKLKKVHPDLQSVVRMALTLSQVDISVTCGVRTLKQQRAMVANGKSWTLKSRHLLTMTPSGYEYAHAVDLCPYEGGKLLWEDMPSIIHVCEAMYEAANEQNLTIECGGKIWGKDWFHFQLPRRLYR